MKKIAVVIAVLLCSLSATGMVLAREEIKSMTESTCILPWSGGCIIPPISRPPIPPIPPKPQPDFQIARGVAVNKYYLTTEPVLFFVYRYNYWDTKMYLIVDGEFYRMNQIESRYDWHTGTRMFKYRADDGSVMVLIAQEYSGVVSVSAIFKNYIITFEPIGHARGHPEPIIQETEIMPVFRELAQGMGIKAGVSAENLISQAKPIAEWSGKAE
jgi:hypothetical protein